MRGAKKQSVNLVINLCRCKLHQSNAISRVKAELKMAHNFKRVIIVTKSQKVVEIL